MHCLIFIQKWRWNTPVLKKQFVSFLSCFIHSYLRQEDILQFYVQQGLCAFATLFYFMRMCKARTHNIIKLAWRLECGWKTWTCCAFLETIRTFLQDIQQAMQWTVLKITNFDIVLISNLRYIPYRIFSVTWLFDPATVTLQTFLFSF